MLTFTGESEEEKKTETKFSAHKTIEAWNSGEREKQNFAFCSHRFCFGESPITDKLVRTTVVDLPSQMVDGAGNVLLHSTLDDVSYHYIADVHRVTML